MSVTDAKLCEMLMQAASQGLADQEMGTWYVPESIVGKLNYLSTNFKNAYTVLGDARNQQNFLINERNNDLEELFEVRCQFSQSLLDRLPDRKFRPSSKADTPPLAGGSATIACSEILGKDFPLEATDPSFLGSKPEISRRSLELMTRSDRHLATNQRDIAAAEIVCAEHRIEAYLLLYALRDRLKGATQHLGPEAMEDTLEAYGFYIQQQ